MYMPQKIVFAGKESYKEPEIKTNKAFINRLIKDIKHIVNEYMKDIKGTDPNFNVKFTIDRKEPSLYFSMDYYGDSPHPSEIIKDIGLKVQEAIENLVYSSFNEKHNFHYDLYPNWENSCSFHAHIRPNKGTFVCPICGEKVENVGSNSYIKNLTNEDVTTCYDGSHRTFFMENFVDKKLGNTYDYEISNELKLFVVDTNKKDHIHSVLQLSIIARSEDMSFCTLSFGKSNTRFYILTENEIPVGYIYWNDFSEKDKERCLRQLFIREDFRRKGYATLLVEKTSELESGDNKFVVESPNEITNKILVKLGIVKREEGQLIGIKCSFISH